MDKVSFRYKEHPGDFFRDASITTLPNPHDDLESFLVQFLTNYQSDDRIAFIDDLHKLLDGDFAHETDRNKIFEVKGNRTDQEIKEEIQRVELELKNEAFDNFYHLVISKRIEIIYDGKK